MKKAKASVLDLMLRFLIVFSILSGACNFLSPAQSQPSQESVETQVISSLTPTALPETVEQQNGTPENPSEPPPVKTAKNPALVFANYDEPPVNAQPAPSISAAPPSIEDIYNPFMLSSQQMISLAENGFVVSPGAEKEFFTVYEKARYGNVPIFVTSDALLHSYHLLFDKILRTAETEHFIPLLQSMNSSLLQRTDEIYLELKGTSWEEAALHTAAFIGVGSRLLDPNVQIPQYTSDLVEAELALINGAGGFNLSPIFPYLENGEDYTQYIPRGHYTRSDALKAYFKSMMWYGRMTFRLTTKNPEAGRAETRSALLLVNALLTSEVNGQPAVKAWLDLYNPTVFFVGKSDDLNLLQYQQVMVQVYGENAPVEVLANDSLLDTFIQEANKLPPPLILGMIIKDTDNEEEETKGLRFMGQRFVPDAYIFRQLIYRNVGTSENRRGLPMGLDLMSVMGSERAYEILDDLGETQYENYPEQTQKMRDWITSLATEEWTETLYNSWLYSFHPLLEVPPDDYPFFMRSTAWQDKQLNTSLGSWAELKHDTILYAKQVYAELGGGPPPPEPVPPRGYVEPVPAFYARLTALTAMTYTGLDQRGLLSELDRDSLKRLQDLSTVLQQISEKELRGEPLSDDEFERIRYIGGELENFVMAASDSDAEDPFAPKFMDEEPQAAVIADVATDPDPAEYSYPVVLEEAVGRVNEIHVAVPVVQEDGSIFWEIAKGGVFSYYEFSWPADDRLTDEKWRGMLEEGAAPPLPTWTSSFFVNEGEYGELRSTIYDFQKSLIFAYWEPTSMVDEGVPGLQPFKAELDALRLAKQYEARQLISTDVSAFDLQSETKAVVTVFETWRDQIFNGEYPDFGAELVSERGPYTITAQYTLELTGETSWQPWEVVQVAYSGQLPEWIDQ
jgi:hypothetical protein